MQVIGLFPVLEIVFLLLLPRMLDLVFALKLSLKQRLQARNVLADAFKMLDALAKGCDPISDRDPLRFVICQDLWIGLMPDTVADL